MKFIIFILTITCYPGGVLLGWGQQRNQSGVRIGTSGRGSSSSVTGRGGSGIKLGVANKGFTMRNISTTSTTTTAQPPEVPTSPPLETHNYHGRLPKLHVSLFVIPIYNSFK